MATCPLLAGLWPSPRSDLGSLTEALQNHVKERIGVWKYPRWIEFVDTLPKTATGKIQRYKLRDGTA